MLIIKSSTLQQGVMQVVHLQNIIIGNLFLVDLNEIDKILIEYDKTIVPKIATSNFLGLLDAASILWRLNVGETMLLL